MKFKSTSRFEFWQICHFLIECLHKFRVCIFSPLNYELTALIHIFNTSYGLEGFMGQGFRVRGFILEYNARSFKTQHVDSNMMSPTFGTPGFCNVCLFDKVVLTSIKVLEYSRFPHSITLIFIELIPIW